MTRWTASTTRTASSRLARLALAFEEPGVVDRERRAVGRDLEQVAVVVGEVARGERADVQDADDAALDEQRDAEEASGCPSRAGSG